MNTKRKIITAVVILLLPLFISVNAQSAKAGFDPGFNPSLLIDDKRFLDTQTFGGAEGIQKFLEKKGSVLANTSQDFLVKLREPGFSDLKTKLEDPKPALGRLRTASELIWDASQQSGLNPQIFIVKLQKEQGLITTRQNDPADRLQRALDFSLGFGCPDNSPCNGIFQGFYFQLFGALDQQGERYLGAGKSLVRAFNTPLDKPVLSIGGKGVKVGDIAEISNTTDPYGVPPTQQVLISNRATAALYRYTPHVFNGNYNFWRYFNEWFKYPNGTIMQVGTDTAKYIIQNGSRFALPTFVAQAKGLDLSTSIVVSPTEVESYPADPSPLGPDDNTIVSVTGSPQKYVFINNLKRPASDFVLKQRKLDPSKTLTITPEENLLFKESEQLTPTDGTVLRGVQDKAVYLVESGKLKAYSGLTFNQYKVAKKVQIVPDAEIASYPKNGFVVPLDGTIVKSASDRAVYEISAGSKKIFSGEIFRNRKISPKAISILSQEEMAGIPDGGSALPANKTFYKVAETGEQFYYNNGESKPLLPLVIKQQKITPDFTFSQLEHNSWKLGTPVAPREGTIVKGKDSDAIYIVSTKKLRPLTFEAFKRRKITPKQIVTIPQTELEQYEKGDMMSK